MAARQLNCLFDRDVTAHTSFASPSKMSWPFPFPRLGEGNELRKMSSKFCLRPPFIPRTPAQRYRSPYWLTKFLATGRWNLHDAAATYNTAGLLIGRDTVTGDKAIAGLETACAHRLQQIDEFLDPPPFVRYELDSEGEERRRPDQ